MGAGQVPIKGSSGGSQPAAAALSDATANPTTTVGGALMEAYNGTTWDRVRNLVGAVTAAGKFSATGLLANIAGGRYTAARPTLADGELAPLQMTTNGNLAVQEQGTATPADAAAPAATSSASSYLWLFNGTNWDRARNTIGAIATGKLTATGLLAALVGGRYAAARPFMVDGEYSPAQVTQRGDWAVQEQASPDYEDNANDVAWTQERVVGAALGAWTNGSTGAAAYTFSYQPKTVASRLRNCGAVLAPGTQVACYLIGINKATAVAANDPSLFAIPLDMPGSAATPTNWVGSANYLDFPGGMYMSAGILLALSATPEKYTATTATGVIFARYSA